MTKKRTYDEVLSSTIGGRLLIQFKEELLECVTVPNRCLPESMRDNRSLDGRTLASLLKKCEKRDALTPHQIEKAEKAKRMQKYAEQMERDGEFTYDEDEDRLYAKTVTFCTHAVRAGMMELDD